MNFEAFLTHLDLGPLFYGLIIAISIIILYVKFITGAWFSLIVDIAVLAFVFSMHKGTLAGGMAATVAALICGIVIPLITGLALRR